MLNLPAPIADILSAVLALAPFAVLVLLHRAGD